MKKILEIHTTIQVGTVKITTETGHFFAKNTGFVSCDEEGNLSSSTVDRERRMHVGEFDFSSATTLHHFMRGHEIKEVLSSLEKHATKI